ncbi:MAG: hypothetical protein MMC23_006051 [Stictis urceolatum]|nr:hypothetical protein [Stictis urceolata]
MDHERGTAGYMEYLPELLAESPEGGFLNEAVRAVALVALGNRGSLERLSLEGRKSYGRSLKGLRESLSRGDKGDGVLGGMMLLGQYELISGDKPASELWQSHSTGQRALISLRGPSQFETARGRALFRCAHIALQLKDLARRTGPSFAATDWPPEVFLAPHGRKLAELSSKVAIILNQARLLLEGKEGIGESLSSRTQAYEGHGMDWWVAVRSTAEEAWGMLGEGEAWEAWVPGHWRYEEAAGLHDLDIQDDSEYTYPSGGYDSEIDPMDILSAGPSTQAASGSGSQSGSQSRASSPDALPRSAFVFPNLLSGANWTSIWVMLCKLIETLIALHDALSSPLSPYPSSALFYPSQPQPSTFTPGGAGLTATPQALLMHKLRVYADKLISSFPYLFGEIDNEGRLVPGGHGKCVGAFFALWPLHMLGGVKVLSKEEKEWVLNRLESVGRVWGIRQADVLAGWRRRNPNIGKDAGVV